MDRVRIYLAQWSIMRFLRLIMGIIIIIQGLKSEMWLIAGLGILFTMMPLLNMGCSANGNCEVPSRNRR